MADKPASPHRAVDHFQSAGWITFRAPDSGRNRRLEERVGEAVIGTELLLRATDAHRAEQAEQDRREKVRRQRAEHDALLARDLIAMAENWNRAETLRRFLAAVEAKLPEPERNDGVRRWLSWASAYADSIDPLSNLGGIAKRVEPKGG
jgi:hypothetical protein